LLRRFVEILPHFDDKRRAVSIVTEIENKISQYLLTVSMMNALVGLLNGVAVWLLGMPDPLLFGTLAFLLNYVPVLGPVTGMVIFFFVGIFTFPSFWEAFIPAAIYLGIHILEGETITPMLLARRFTLNPVVVISSLMFWDWLWGIPGALLSTPLLAVVKIICDHIEVMTPLGHLLGATPAAQKPEQAILILSPVMSPMEIGPLVQGQAHDDRCPRECPGKATTCRRGAPGRPGLARQRLPRCPATLSR
jgi:predicted PurR-regulated permease PerM